MQGRPLFLAAPVVSLLLASSLSACGEDKNKPRGDTPPPPLASASSNAAGPSPCAAPGEVKDAVSAAFFPQKAGGYCVDPNGETKTYGEKGKLSMDEVCTTAFDGECEVYKRFGLKRVVSFHYVDGAAKGGGVEVIVSQFADDPGAYGMYTMRVVAADPLDPSAPRVLAAGASGALGTGRAYVWKGPHLVELQYNNEQESPEQLAKSSEAILSAVAKEIGTRLPGTNDKPGPARNLPSAGLVPNGIQFFTKDPFGLTGLGQTASGSYQEDGKRYRVVSFAAQDADAAKDVVKTLKGRPGSLPVPGVGDEAVHVALGAKDGPKVDLVVARKGALLLGVGDDDFALRGKGGEAARYGKDGSITKLKALLLLPVVSPSSPSPSPSAPASSVTSPSSASSSLLSPSLSSPSSSGGSSLSAPKK